MGRLIKVFYQRFSILYLRNYYGGLAQLARALAWHARGRRFDPDTLHIKSEETRNFFAFYLVHYFYCLISIPHFFDKLFYSLTDICCTCVVIADQH